MTLNTTFYPTMHTTNSSMYTTNSSMYTTNTSIYSTNSSMYTTNSSIYSTNLSTYTTNSSMYSTNLSTTNFTSSYYNTTQGVWEGLLWDLYYQHDVVFDIIDGSGVAICLIVQLIMGIYAHCQFHRNSRTTKSIKQMFFFSLCLGSAACISYLFYIFGASKYISQPSYTWICDSYVDSWSWELGWLFFLFFNYLFWVSLLANLVFRLHLTFYQSAYKMSPSIICIFKFIFIAEVCVVILLIAADVSLNFGIYYGCWPWNPYHDIIYWTYDVLWWIYLLFFVIGSILAVRYFVKSLSKLAQSQVDTPKLAATRQRLIDLSTKYLLLYGIALFSTILSAATCYILWNSMWGILSAIDYCINLLALYLQFASAQKLYRRCCGCLDRQCKKIVHDRSTGATRGEMVRLQTRTHEMQSILSD